jgi:cell division transport system ATP-binding protein
VIESYHLSKLYKRGVYALRDLSLTIEKGEFLFLTGPSGAGKSTFLRLLLREDLPSEGDLKVLGRDLKTLRPSQVQTFRRSVGFVFQDFRLIPRFTVFENVSFVMRVLGVPVTTQQRKTFQVLKWVGLQHRIHAFPRSCRAANSSGLRLLARSSTTRSWCWPTSRRATSIRISRSKS